MAKVLAEMGEVDEVHEDSESLSHPLISRAEPLYFAGVLLNGSAMEVDNEEKPLPDASSNIKDTSMDSKDEEETESSREDGTSQSAMDEDSQDSHAR